MYGIATKHGMKCDQDDGRMAKVHGLDTAKTLRCQNPFAAVHRRSLYSGRMLIGAACCVQVACLSWCLRMRELLSLNTPRTTKQATRPV